MARAAQREAGCDDAALAELVELAVRGTVRSAGSWARHRQSMTWAALMLLAAVAAAAAMTADPAVLLAWPMAVLVLPFSTTLLVLLRHRRGGGGRRLVVERGPAGRAFAAVRARDDEAGRVYWQVSDLVSIPAPGPPRAAGAAQGGDSTRRPGARLIRCVLAQARAKHVEVHLRAANQALAIKVYAPEGFDYTDNAQRHAHQPHMRWTPPAGTQT